MKGLLDTSVFIAAESGRPLDEQRIPQEAAVSVVTLAELQAGVLAAADVDVRARRLATLEAIGDIELIGTDEAAVRMWARLRVHLAESGRRVNVTCGSRPSPRPAGSRSSRRTTTSARSRASRASRSSGSDG